MMFGNLIVIIFMTYHCSLHHLEGKITPIYIYSCRSPSLYLCYFQNFALAI